MSERRFEAHQRIRYTGSTTNLRGRTGQIAYYYYSDQWIVQWDEPRPTDRYGRQMWRSRPIRGTNLTAVPVGQSSHGLWVA